jgi:pyruvate/2-oxoglutarate/acetoin dehydrogenase E1 component
MRIISYPLGRHKIIKRGFSMTIITYGNATHITLNALKELEKNNISTEILICVTFSLG